MEKSLGTTLKELRKKMNLTAKDVSIKLKEMGYTVSDKTLSGYENDIRMPNADIFMALCQIYHCKNVLEIFSFVKADYSIPTDFEWTIIEKYRSLDPHGKEMVDVVLEKEYARWQSERSRPATLKDAASYEPSILAAHARTDIESTPEGQAHDLDIMFDDKEWE